jgi:tetratricopeptide (TPR) repeat protein
MLPLASRKQAEIWKDPVTLFSETAKRGVGSRYGFYANYVEYNLVKTCSRKAELLMLDGKFKEALAYSRKAIEVDPMHFESLLRLAFLLLNEGKYSAAYHYNLRLIDNFPNRFEGFYSIGEYYMTVENPVQAEKAFQCALALNPTYQPALKCLSDIYQNK